MSKNEFLTIPYPEAQIKLIRIGDAWWICTWGEEPFYRVNLEMTDAGEIAAEIFIEGMRMQRKISGLPGYRGR